MEGPYQLIASQIVHDGPIRSIAIGPSNNEILTGCQGDVPCVRRWRLSNDMDSFEEIGSPLYHDHWVTALTSLSPDMSRSFMPMVSSIRDVEFQV
jgi:WD40 repeat protein